MPVFSGPFVGRPRGGDGGLLAGSRAGNRAANLTVVCGGALHHLRDTSGCDDDFAGETLLALVRLCFPDDDISGMNGHEPRRAVWVHPSPFG